MSPLEAAEHEMEERGFLCDTADARAIITAFLEAAAEDRASTFATGLAANGKYGVSLTEIGKAVILALKEAVE